MEPMRRTALIRGILLFTNYFLIIAALYQLKPASRSIFIEQVGSEHLPYVWIATAISLALIISLYNRLVARFSRMHVVIGTVAILISLLGLFRLLLNAPTQVTAFAFYIFVDILSVILVEQFWSLTNSINSEQDGHRWYALIGTGGLLGGVLGGMGAHALITYAAMNTLDLLLVAATILLLLMALTLLMQRCGLYHEQSTAAHERHVDSGFWRTIIGNRYLTLIAALLLLSQIIEPLVEFQFMHAVEAAYGDREARTAYLGSFFSLLSGVAIAINLILTPLIHRWLGAIAGLAMQPLSVAVSTMFFIANPTLLTAATLKIADRGLSYSINRASKELLYIPIDAVLIFQAKAWIDMFGYRVFKILGSVMILLLTQWLWFTVSVPATGWLSLIICITWMAVLVGVKREYRKVSRHSLNNTDR
ncbi:ATP translocase [Mariprofundus erugo]|uniref:ADP,ATP carrier protein n=1 Tax=Mariprofundus erugo TaxID=2528639 RepID=A0A5R9GH08_9PROT|nr:Npt1/Npt2 family nucleotide transporter [Mariprofundus erugo]TLS65700.1 ATP translocase [Mariprofundus erugo]